MSARQLRFISGKYQGGTYQLADGDEVVMGRGMDAGLTLFEEMVSRHHARFSVEDGAVVVEDLRSKNGTFVNGERIERCELAIGDRILMGTSILRLEKTSDKTAQEAAAPSVAPGLEPEQQERVAALETALPSSDAYDDLDFDESSLTGATATSLAAAIASMAEDEDEEDDVEDEAAEAELVRADEPADDEHQTSDNEDEPPALEPDEMVFDDPLEEPSLAESETQPPYDDALMDEGEDEVDPFADDDDDPVVTELTVPGDTATTGHSGIDEAVYRERWGDAPLSVYLAHPMQPSLEFLSPEQLSALQAAHNHGNLSGIAEALRKDDERIKKTVTFLLRSGYLDAT